MEKELSIVIVIGNDKKWIRAYLNNDSSFQYRADIEIQFRHRPSIKREVFIQPSALEELTTFAMDEINEYPMFHIDVEKYSTKGKEASFFSVVKLKPAHLIKGIQIIEGTNLMGRIFPIQAPVEKPKFTPSKKIELTQGQDYVQINRTDFESFANAPKEIDLHIERLATTNVSKLSKGEMLHIQLTELEKFITSSSRIGLDSVFVIHGVGDGKLKNQVHRYLNAHSQVIKLEYGYFKQYGFGATRVFL